MTINAKQCYLLLFKNCIDQMGHSYYCVESATTVPGSCGVVQVINGINTGVGAKILNFIPVSQVGAYPIPPEYSTRYDSGYYGACCDSKQYDCINGACTNKSTYNTPGLYQTLSDCETACGTGCSGKCISNSDWAQIENLSGQLKSRNCS
ncbi:hypothetical protein [Nostoc commune]|nr:hypothetical protein [Nostoc commune]